MKYLSLLFFLISSCGAPYGSIDKTFLEYTQRFTAYTGIQVIVPITFSDLKNNYVGVCISYIDGRKEIEIDSAFWNEAEDLIKEELIFHELGHCILNRGHDNTMVEAVGYPYKIPNSIMNRYVFGHSRFYRQFHDHYIEELLNPGKQL